MSRVEIDKFGSLEVCFHAVLLRYTYFRVLHMCYRIGCVCRSAVLKGGSTECVCVCDYYYFFYKQTLSV